MPVPTWSRPGLLLLAGLAAVGGCAPSTPPLAFGGDTAFKARMAERYPPGSAGDRLRTDLVADGFSLASDPAGRRWIAVDVPENLPCYGRTRVDWREDARGRIRVLTAQTAACS